MLNKFVVVDLETSGLDPVNDRIIEVGAIKWADGKIVGEFSAIINYTGPLSAGTLEKTGMTSQDLIHGMDEKTALKMLDVFMGDFILVAHNAIFELGFLENTFKRLFNKSIKNHFIDTLTVCRDRYTYPHKLEDMCELLDIWPDTKHRALSDCYFCGRLFMELDQNKSVDEWINKIGFNKKFGPPTWHPDYASVFPQEILYGAKREKFID